MRYLFLFVLAACLSVSCKNQQELVMVAPNPAVAPVPPAPEPELPTERPRYNPSRTLAMDLIHTRLDVRFDMKLARLNGKAWLKLTPWFYPQDTLVLDAKGFDIHTLALDNGKGNHTKLNYRYDSLQLFISLDKTYKKGDTLNLYIQYTAKPNERRTGGSEAITSDKGLYFIDPLNEDPHKPTQIWTQGETEASSAWFPTIDTPNEKTTQELCITVDKKYVTLSNGILQYSTANSDGTRTDCWKQDLPHAPYLFMMAIGEYTVVKDKWKNLEVNYYMEPDYAKYARDIFGNTPEMIQFFSDQLGVVYPWDKYHQVIVRDYVSGAMENTGAVIFGEFMNKTDRELLDDDNEAIIAHELYHHWFGDLVTTESWANLPLNESFATYGEYLWFEHKYGRDEADEHGLQGLTSYLFESRNKQVDMIRYDYIDKEDMFDSHSYAKGGRILHMLRKYVGDDAFFASLKKYLDDNRLGTAEIHDLRLAFEATTGEDLNWFFDQWFLNSGHPRLSISTTFDKLTGTATVKVIQKQNLGTTPIYRLPIAVDIYKDNKVERHQIVVDELEETFEFYTRTEPDFINVDAEKMLLAEISESKTAGQYAFQYRNAPLYLDRLQGLEGIVKAGNDSLARAILTEGMKDKFSGLRVVAIRNFRKVATDETKKTIIPVLTRLVTQDPESEVRAAAVNYLAGFEDESLIPVFTQALKDSSYAVAGGALEAIAKINPTKALELATAFERENNPGIISQLAALYSNYGTAKHNQYFTDKFEHVNSFSRFSFVSSYQRFLSRQDIETTEKALPLLEQVARQEGPWWMRMSGIQALLDIQNRMNKKAAELDKSIASADAAGENTTSLQTEKQKAQQLADKTLTILRDLRSTETDENLLKLLNN